VLVRLSRTLAVALVLATALAGVVHAADLRAEDRKLLDELLRTTVYDPPPEAERVVAKVPLRTCWGHKELVDREAWLLPAKGESPPRWVWADGRTEPAPVDSAAAARRVDLAAVVRERLKPRDAGHDATFAEMSRIAGRGAQTDPDLALAAWLHKRGEDGLAAEVVRSLRSVKTGEI
jgi:hypothetical protein